MIIILAVALFILGALIWFKPSLAQYSDPWERWPANGDRYVLVGFLLMAASTAALAWRVYVSFT